MKGFVKLLIAGGVILCIGVIILIIGLAANGWQWGINVDFEQKEYIAESTVEAYDIRVAAGTVRVEFTDSPTVSVSYPDSKDFGYEVTEQDGKLTIAYNKTSNVFLGWFMPINIPDTVIKMPYGAAADTEIRVDAGKLILADGGYGDIDATLNAGAIQTGVTECDKLNIKINAGSAKLSSVTAQNLGIEVNAGAITVDNAECDRLTVDVSAGGATVSRAKCDDISVDVSAGSATLGVDGAEAEYNISVNRSAGHCNRSSQIGSNPSKRVTVDISAGSAEINFSN